MIVNHQPHTSQVFMATDTHYYLYYVNMTYFASPMFSVSASLSLPTRDQPTVLSQQHCKYSCNSACLQIGIVLSEQE